MVFLCWLRQLDFALTVCVVYSIECSCGRALGDCYKSAVRLLASLTMRRYWLGSTCFACAHVCSLYFDLFFLLDSLLALLDRVPMYAAHEDDCYKRAVSLLVGFTMRSYCLGSTCFAHAYTCSICFGLRFFAGSDNLTSLWRFAWFARSGAHVSRAGG